MKKNKKRNQKVLARKSSVLAFDRTCIEYYDSTHNGEPVVRFRVIGANGEIIPHPYSNLSNAKRGSQDLYEALKKVFEPRADAA